MNNDIQPVNTDPLDFKIDTVKLQQGLLDFFFDKLGTLVSREELDLLGHALLTSNKVGFIKFFSYCEKTDFAIATYDTLHQKITSLYPTLKLDKKIRFFHGSSYTLRTQEQIEAIVNERYLAPTPLNEICVSKDLAVLWCQHGKDNNVGVMRMPITNTFAKDLSKSILAKAKSDSFRWSKNKSKELSGCSIQIKTIEEWRYLLGDLINSPIQNSKDQIDKIEQAIKQANTLEDQSGITVFFKTKRPTKDKSERKEWVQPEPKHYTLAGLKARKWSARLIEKYLGEPDTYFHNARNPFSPTHGYEIARVKKVEKTKTFKNEFKDNRKKLVKTAK